MAAMATTSQMSGRPGSSRATARLGVAIVAGLLALGSVQCGSTEDGALPGGGSSGAAGAGGAVSSKCAGWTRLAEQVCQVLPDCGCEGAKTCRPTDDGKGVCDASGPQGAYAECASDADCSPGLICIRAEHSSHAECMPVCTSGGDACPTHFETQGVCSKVGTTGARVCELPCNLTRATEMCGPGHQCDVVDNADGSRRAVCIPSGGAGLAGTACEGPTTCAPGHACFEKKCRQWCIQGKTACPAPAQCLLVNPAVLINGIDYGVCFP